MLTAPRITIEEIKDDDERSHCDFTPEDRRVFRRSLNVTVGEPETGITLRLSEWDFANPDSVDVALYIKKPAGYKDQIFLEGPVTVEQLEAVIEVLTLARDTAIVEGMIAPVAS